MTKKELSQLYHLNREIEEDKIKLKHLENAAVNISSKISGLPHIGGISNKTAIATDIADIKAIIDAKIKITINEYNRLNRYISGIEDSLVRQIITYRYVNGFSWLQVANCIGGGNTADSIKKIAYRFLSK